MSGLVSRRRLAAVVADQLQTHPVRNVMRALATYLAEERMTAKADLLLRDIEAEFAARGKVVADVTSARELNDTSRSLLMQFIASETGATSVELREDTDAELIGGVIIQAPGKYLDASLRGQLNRLNNVN